MASAHLNVAESIRLVVMIAANNVMAKQIVLYVRYLVRSAAVIRCVVRSVMSLAHLAPSKIVLQVALIESALCRVLHLATGFLAHEDVRLSWGVDIDAHRCVGRYVPT